MLVRRIAGGGGPEEEEEEEDEGEDSVPIFIPSKKELIPEGGFGRERESKKRRRFDED